MKLEGKEYLPLSKHFKKQNSHTVFNLKVLYNPFNILTEVLSILWRKNYLVLTSEGFSQKQSTKGAYSTGLNFLHWRREYESGVYHLSKFSHGLRWCVCSLASSCPTHCDPKDCGPPASSVHGIFHARILERVAIPFSRSSWLRDRTEVPWIAGRFSYCPGDSVVKNPPANAGDLGLTPGLARSHMLWSLCSHWACVHNYGAYALEPGTCNY